MLKLFSSIVLVVLPLRAHAATGTKTLALGNTGITVTCTGEMHGGMEMYEFTHSAGLWADRQGYHADCIPAHWQSTTIGMLTGGHGMFLSSDCSADGGDVDFFAWIRSDDWSWNRHYKQFTDKYANDIVQVDGPLWRNNAIPGLNNAAGENDGINEEMTMYHWTKSNTEMSISRQSTNDPGFDIVILFAAKGSIDLTASSTCPHTCASTQACSDSSLTKDPDHVCYGSAGTFDPNYKCTGSYCCYETGSGTLNDIGDDPSGTLGLCVGDCDGDHHCEGDLVCKSHAEAKAAGCLGTGRDDYQYCAPASGTIYVPPPSTCADVSCSHASLNKGASVTCTGDDCKPDYCCKQIATCSSSFDASSCAHSSLYKQDASCTGDTDHSTCTASECCDARANCGSSSLDANSCAHSSLYNTAALCVGDSNTCAASECCDAPATCGPDFVCNDPFKVNKLADSALCVGNADTCNADSCCVANNCGFTEWGDGLPFSQNGGIEFNGNNIANIQVTFGVLTETCVDRKNWLKTTLHKLGNPVCQARDPAHAAHCGALAATSDQSLEQVCKLAANTDKCRFRIPCGVDALTGVNDAPFDVAPNRITRDNTKDTQETKFTISIETAKLAAATEIYSQPSESDPKAKLEFCVRPAVKVSDTTILFREIALRAHIGMDGSFSGLQIASDSFQDGAVQDVDSSLSFTASAFACKVQDGSSDKYEQYASNAIPTLTPNQIFTLCVVPSSKAVKCDDIDSLIFKQTREVTGGSPQLNEDKRIVNTVPQSILTSDPITAEVKTAETTPQTFTGCVVSSRLGPDYFASVSPGAVTMSGSALLGFASTGRKLRAESNLASMAVFEKRKLQADEDQIADFDVKFELASDEDANNRPQVDAAENVGGVCLTTAVAAVAVSNLF